MLRIRLTRTGAKKRPSYRLIVTDSHAPRDGRHVDIVGHYNPMTTPSTVNIDTERAVQWLRNGAQPSERVRVLLRHAGVLKAHEEARLADKQQRKAAAAAAPPKEPKKPARAATKASAASTAAPKRAPKASASGAAGTKSATSGKAARAANAAKPTKGSGAASAAKGAARASATGRSTRKKSE